MRIPVCVLFFEVGYIYTHIYIHQKTKQRMADYVFKDKDYRYIHAYINTYIHTCMHAYMHTYTYTCTHMHTLNV